MKSPQLRAVVAVCAWGAAFCAAAAEPYAGYDNFAATQIDRSKWSALERVREVRNGQLNLVFREVGGTGSDSGVFANGWTEDLTLQNRVTQIRARVRVNALEVSGCAANASASFARARLLGTFFQTGVPVPGSFTGDVMGQIRIGRFSNSADAPGVLRVQANAFVCGDASCGVVSLLGSTQDLGTTTAGANVELQMEWLPALKKFVFVRDGGAFQAEVPYTLSDSASPARPLMQLSTRTELANCASGPQTTSLVDASFDNVAVNANARP